MSAAKAEANMKDQVPVIIEFANSIGKDQHMDDTVVRNCVNLLGDILSTVPSTAAVLQRYAHGDWEKLLGFCNENSHLQDDTQWALSVIQNAAGRAIIAA